MPARGNGFNCAAALLIFDWFRSVAKMGYENDPRFLKGIDEFNQQLFFECHETLEELWLEEHGEERRFFQAIIQIAAGYFKLQQQVPVGAVKLWRTGLEKLMAYQPVYLGMNVEALMQNVQANLASLESARARGAPTPDLEIPSIQLIC
jgi:predicted metal-dependent hydrolase